MKLTAKQIIEDLICEKGYSSKDFCQSSLNKVLNRLGYTLKKVRKVLPLKRIAQTGAIFENVHQHRRVKKPGVLSLSIDVKDKIKVGRLSRNGYHRNTSHVLALDKDQHWQATLVPLGILEIDTAQATVVLGNSFETSDFIVDGLEKWYECRKQHLTSYHTLEIYLDNGPSQASNRSQFINRLMEFACITGLKIHLLYYPPYHSKYNPVERFWARVENYWNATLLTSVEKVIATLANITWKGVKVIPIFLDKQYEKGVKLSRKQMDERETFLIRNIELPKWDVWIRPNFFMGMLFYK